MKCKECGQEFEVSDKEERFFKSKGLEIVSGALVPQAANRPTTIMTASSIAMIFFIVFPPNFFAFLSKRGADGPPP